MDCSEAIRSDTPVRSMVDLSACHRGTVLIVTEDVNFSAVASRVLGSLEIDASALAARIGPLPFSLDDGLAATAAWWRAAKV